MWDAKPIAVIACSLVALAGCPSAFQRTLPVAIENHTGALATSGGEFAISPPVTFSAIWNAAGRVLTESFGGVVDEDAQNGTMTSDFAYSTPPSPEATTTVQQRRRAVLVVPPGTTNLSQVRIRVEVGQRQRGIDQPATDWYEVGGGDPNLEADLARRLRDAAAGGRSIPLASVHWAAPPDEASRQVSRRLTIYRAAAGTDPTALETEWRTSEEPLDQNRLVVRSRIRFLFDDAGNGASRISVLGEAQYRVEALPSEASGSASWVDIDASRVAAHGWATVRAAVEPVAEAAQEVPLEQFARTARPTPDLPDARSQWETNGAPAGVARTTTGGQLEVAWFGNQPPEELLGQAFTGDFQPAGRIDLMGSASAAAVQESGQFTTVLTDERSIELSGGYLVFSGSVRQQQGRTMITHSVYADQTRHLVPEFANFASLPANARYYIASVTTGQAGSVYFLGTTSEVTSSVEARYEGLQAGLTNSVREGRMRCEVRFRGVSGSLPCDAQHIPSGRDLQLAREAGQQEAPAVTRVVFRRIPGRVPPGSPPASIRVTRLQVLTQACDDVMNGPDLTVSWRVGLRSAPAVPCPDNSRVCPLDATFGPNDSPVFTVEERDDFTANDACGEPTAFDVRSWLAPDVDALPPGPIIGTQTRGTLTLRYEVRY
jgi:hypothetical protein